MIKYIKLAGYRFIEHYNDLTDKQFTLENSVMFDSEQSTFGNSVLDRVDTYKLFVKSIDVAVLQGQIMDMLNSAISDGINVSAGTAVEVENVENGYNITINFTIRG
jgi:hypothetical protein